MAVVVKTENPPLSHFSPPAPPPIERFLPNQIFINYLVYIIMTNLKILISLRQTYKVNLKGLAFFIGQSTAGVVVGKEVLISYPTKLSHLGVAVNVSILFSLLKKKKKKVGERKSPLYFFTSLI